MAIAFGGMTGALFGSTLFGLLGGTIGTLFGGAVGFTIGYTIFFSIPNRLLERSVRRKSTSTLRAELNEDYIPGTFVSSLIISILLERGEPVESFREYVFRQLNSEYVTWRRAGLRNLALCFPALAARLEGFDPFHPTQDDLERLKEIEATRES